MNNRRVAATVLAIALAVPALAGATRLIGWGFGSSSTPVGDSADSRALRAFADSLRTGQDQTFTIWYSTGQGVAVVRAQEPPMRAYRSPHGVYVGGPDGVFLCRTPAQQRPQCGRAAGSDGLPLAHARGLTALLQGQFVAPELVEAYLSRLAARPPGRVERSERVIVGQPVTCMAVATVFSACATASGVLASFESPDGSLTMRGYQPTLATGMFGLPDNATMSDLDS